MQFRVRVPIILGLLMACCHSSANAQINSGSFYHGEPVLEPYYNADRFTTGSYQDAGPAWLGQASFDVLLFDRADADSRAIANRWTTVDLGPPTGVVDVLGDEVANATDLGFPVTAGFRFNLVLLGDDGCDLVFNYLGSRFESSRTFDGATIGYPFFEFETEPENGAMYKTSYESTLNSVELNSRIRRWSRLTPFAGVRFIQLEDKLTQSLADNSAYLDRTTTDNELWGFQLGAEALLLDAGRARLQATVKGGVFYNNLELSTSGSDFVLARDPVTMEPTSTYTPDESFSTEHVSYFGEVNLEFTHRIGPSWAVRVGYAAMWLDGVALAPDQNDNFNLMSGFGTFNYGTVLYHGSYVGIEATW